MISSGWLHAAFPLKVSQTASSGDSFQKHVCIFNNRGIKYGIASLGRC